MPRTFRLKNRIRPRRSRRRGSSPSASPGAARAASSTRPSRARGRAVQQPDRAARELGRACATEGDLDVGAEQHREHDAVPRPRTHLDRSQSAPSSKQPPEPGVGPAPVVLRRRVVDLHAVRRGKHASAGRGDAPQLAHGVRRVVTVLEHLRAEDDVEARVVDRKRLDRPASSAAGFSTMSTPTYSLARSAKKG